MNDKKKNDKKKNVKFGLIILAAVIAIIVIILCIIGKDSSDDIVLKDNVVIITSETEESLQPYEVRENALFFKKDPKYKVGDVVVSGITDAAQNGYVRRITSIEKSEEGYIYYTEYATLVDVFEKVHFSTSIPLSGTDDFGMNAGEPIYLAYNGDGLGILASNFIIGDRDNPDMDDLISVEFEGDIDDEVHVEGNVGAKVWLDMVLDIEDGEVYWELTANDRIQGEVLFGFSASAEKEFEKEFFKKQLPNIQFMIGPVPVVITNDISAKLEGEVGISGEIGNTVSMNVTRTAGFCYSSDRDEVKEINTQNFLTGGLEWDTGVGAEGDANAGVFIYLTSLLYDCSGADIALGLEGKAEGEVGINAESLQTESRFYGSLELAIYPQLKGGVIVEIPVIDDELAEIPLFEKSLEPLWSEQWSIDKPENDGTIAVGDCYDIYKKVVNATIKQNETQSKIYFDYYFDLNWEEPQDWVGGYTSGYPSQTGELVYALKDVRNKKDGYPELFIGVKNQDEVKVLAVYTFSGADAMGNYYPNVDLMTVKKIEDSGEILYVAWTLSIYESDFTSIFPSKSYGFGCCCSRETFANAIDDLDLEWKDIYSY